jgi:hypothetical protein
MARCMAMASVAVRIGGGGPDDDDAAAAADDDEAGAAFAFFCAGEAPSAAGFRLRGFFADAGATGAVPLGGAVPVRQVVTYCCTSSGAAPSVLTVLEESTKATSTGLSEVMSGHCHSSAKNGRSSVAAAA